MKTFLRSAVAVAALAIAVPAFAADLIYSEPVIAVPVEAVPVVSEPVYDPGYDWTGFYAGIVAGHSWLKTEHFATGSGEFDAAGYLLGGTIGYNLEIDDFVVGAEADLVWNDANGASGAYTTDLDWSSTLRARAGYSFDNILPYVTGGFTLADVNASGPAYTTDERQLGWNLGAGVEVGVTENVSVKAEYLYTDMWENNPVSNNSGLAIDTRGHAVRTGVNFSF